MAQQILNYGTSNNDGTGDGLRDTFIKTDDNFTELYNRTFTQVERDALINFPTDFPIFCTDSIPGGRYEYYNGFTWQGIADDYGNSLIFQGELSNDIVISNQIVDLTAPLCALNQTNRGGSPFYYDNVNNLIRCSPDSKPYFNLNVLLRASGTITNVGNDTFSFLFVRPDDVTVFSRVNFEAITLSSLTNEFIMNLPTYVDQGGADNFQLPLDNPPAIGGGFKIKIERVTGNATLTFTGSQSLRIVK